MWTPIFTLFHLKTRLDFSILLLGGIIPPPNLKTISEYGIEMKWDPLFLFFESWPVRNKNKKKIEREEETNLRVEMGQFKGSRSFVVNGIS